MSVDDDAARSADSLPAVVVEGDRILSFEDQLLVSARGMGSEDSGFNWNFVISANMHFTRGASGLSTHQ